MADSVTNITQIIASQANKEVTLNSITDAMSPAALYGRNAVTTAALTWGYFGGTVLIGGTPTKVPNGIVTLAASTTNYIEANPADGTVSVNQTGFTSGRTPLYTVATGAATAASWSDLRVLGGGGGSGTVKSVNTKTPDGSGAVTLTASDVGADSSGAASSAVSAHVAATDPHPQYLTQAEGDTRYASSAAATGVSSVNGHTGTVTLAASDVGAVPTTALGAVSGVAQLGSDQKLLPSQLPDLGIVDFLGTVVSQTAMLALTGQKGDWCIRSDDGKVYTITGSNPASAASWTAMSYPVGNGGTVTSVGLAVPGLLYTVSGSPITGSGTLTFSLNNQVANTFLAGPMSGAAAAPTMRTITGADLPLFGASGTGHAPGAVPDPGATAGTTKFLREDGTWQVPPGTSSGGTSTTQNILSNQRPTGTLVSQKNEYQTVAASATQNLFTYSGSDGYVSSILLACDSTDQNAYMKGIVNIYCNGETTPSISCAAENMFMAAYMTASNLAFSNNFLGANSSTASVISLQFRLPIPFTNSIRIDFVSGSTTTSMRLFSTVVAQVGVANTWPRTRKLHIQPYYNAGVAPYANVSLVSASGLSPGLFVGLWMLFDDYPNNVTPKQAELEGNISINLDSAGTAQYISSGTEDYFMLGYYGAGVVPCFCQNGEIGTTFTSGTFTKSFFRLHGTDPMAFQNALSINWQCGDASQVAFTGNPRVWATAYYYTE